MRTQLSMAKAYCDSVREALDNLETVLERLPSVCVVKGDGSQFEMLIGAGMDTIHFIRTVTDDYTKTFPTRGWTVEERAKARDAMDNSDVSSDNPGSRPGPGRDGPPWGTDS